MNDDENIKPLTDLVTYVVKALIDNTENISISVDLEDDIQVIKVSVDEADRGKIIGKQGRIAKAIRTLTRAAAIKRGKKVLLKIVD